jgi:hypothetical protein
MTDKASLPPSHHRHASHPTSRDRRRRVSVIALGVLLVAAFAAALVTASWDRSDAAGADRPVAGTAPSSLPAPTVTVTATATTTATATSDVPGTFVDAMQQLGIPMDPDTGWVVAQGICVRLGQPAQYDEFKMSEGVERMFPSVDDDQAHAFVDMVASSVCQP